MLGDEDTGGSPILARFLWKIYESEIEPSKPNKKYTDF